jgi:2-dehydropantoate 2-reductase
MKTRIGILGLGGVGGYFGGLLAQAYSNSESIEIVFIARGETQNNISQNGLKIITPQGDLTVFAKLVSNNPDAIGVLDYLICATKTYDIEESLGYLKKCIAKNTIILPLYNGVDATKRINKLFPENIVLQGCVYIVSMIVTPGVIQKVGPYEKLFFGSKTVAISKLKALQIIFEKAGFESCLVDNIEETVWEKFIFISALASVTSYLNENIGAVLTNENSKAIYIKLLHEIVALAFAKGIKMPIDIIAQTIVKLEKSPHDATSSMHRDLLAGHKTEVASLTAYIVNEAIKYGIETPTYKRILDDLLQRMITPKL